MRGGASAGYRSLRGGSGQDFSNSCRFGAVLNFAGAAWDRRKNQPPPEFNIYLAES